MAPDEEVKRFWDGRAREQPAAGEVTHSDIWQRWLEIEMVKRYLKPSHRVLDTGCGNGYATRRYAPLVAEILGTDYSQEMIDRARMESADDRPRAGFERLDVLELGPERFGTFDVVISTRLLINLASWENQQRGLRNIGSVVRPGGHFLFVEGWAEGRAALNDARKAAGLGEMPKVWHNIDFEEKRTLDALAPQFEVADRRHFGVYDFVARLVHPLLVAPDPPKYDAKINEVAARLALDRQDCPQLSRVMFLVLRRR